MNIHQGALPSGPIESAADAARRRLREMLAAAGRRPAKISRAIGCGVDYIGDFLSGKKATITLEAAAALARELGVSLDDLAGLHVSSPAHPVDDAPIPDRAASPP